jgi:hypothetical protein
MIPAVLHSAIVEYVIANPNVTTLSIVTAVPARRADVLQALNELASSTLCASEGQRGARTWAVRPDAKDWHTARFRNQSRPREARS